MSETISNDLQAFIGVYNQYKEMERQHDIELSHIPLIEELNDCYYQQRIFKWIKTADDCVEFKLGVWGF